MRRILLSCTSLVMISALTAATQATGLTSEPARQDALDPTRIGRLVCGTIGKTTDTLEKRLKFAASLAVSQQASAATIQLYSQINPTDIPAPELKEMAARYFAQGLALSYGFNHAAAIRSFRNAQQIDPDCALCYWGEALANGPNINAGMSDDGNIAALAALKRAVELSTKASPAAKALIEAQALRYRAGGGDRAALDATYAEAMLKVAAAYPQSDDIAVLAAEAVMNTSPWNYWETTDTPFPQIVPGIALIEKVIARNPAHPQASHLYIHLMEATQPKMAEAAADRMAGGTAPGALGHLVHMPSHIYFRTGRYADSMKANVAAVQADEAYLADVGDDGIYRYGYYPHNVHFLLTSAQMAGDMKLTVSEASKLASIVDVEVARELPWVQAIHAAPAFAMAQYASPQAILAVTGEASPLAYVEAMRHYARAIANARAGDDAAYTSELTAMEQLAVAPDVTAMVDAGFPAPDIIKLAALVAQGRKAHWDGQFDKSVAYFTEAEKLEAAIPYNEPPFWYYPIAQSRGAALYSAGRYDEAREAFRKALFTAPNNGWALYGLGMTEAKLGHEAEARAAENALKRVWLGDVAWLNMERL